MRQILKGLFPGLTGVTPVDLHGSKEFCVDVSQYKDVTWVEREGEMCTAEFEKVCEDYICWVDSSILFTVFPKIC